jgi:hypothetical protein
VVAAQRKTQRRAQQGTAEGRFGKDRSPSPVTSAFDRGFRHAFAVIAGTFFSGKHTTMIAELVGWKPSISLRDGLERACAWIHDQVAADTGATRV